MQYEAELRVALEAAAAASEAILKCYADFQAIPHAPASISTDADRLAQEIILSTVQKAFPGDAHCAEETSAAGTQVAGTGPRVWVVDPIDGTRGFAQKNNEFSVMVAFLHNGTVAVGVVQEPAKKRLTWAVKDEGCWRRDGTAAEPTRCHVSRAPELTEATLVQTRSRDPGVPTEEVRKLQPARVLETYSAGVKLAMVARGEADIYVNNYSGSHDWDFAAGHILVTEAGGAVTGMRGEEIRYGQEGAWQRFGLLATNGKLHAAALKQLAKVI
jgi:3'(2'), 5'-bisphosphate nucleotidase